jgi:hypothetical protein
LGEREKRKSGEFYEEVGRKGKEEEEKGTGDRRKKKGIRGRLERYWRWEKGERHQRDI